jgi:hypothetical protein
MNLHAGNRDRAPTLGVIAMLVSLCGCQHAPPLSGPPVFPVTGTILVDGKPTAGVTVRFVAVEPAGGSPPAFITGSDGRFTSAAPGSDAGVSAGTYRLVVYWLDTPPSGGMPFDRLFGKYADPDRSALTVTIDPNVPDIGTLSLTSRPSR